MATKIARADIQALADNPHFDLVLIPRGEKGPRTNAWQERDSPPAAAGDFADDNNVGTRLGVKLVDVDCDCPETIEIADKFLPRTDLVHGRTGAPRAHRFYKPIAPMRSAQFKDADNKMLVELRGLTAEGNHLQTMIPPSVHPSGERLAWDSRNGQPGDPGPAEETVLLRAVTFMAIVALCARHWPASGHDARLALAGYLLKAKPTKIDEVTEGDVRRILEYITRLAKGEQGHGLSEALKDADTVVRSTAARLRVADKGGAAAKDIVGRSGLVEALGGEDLGAKIVARLDKFLGNEAAVRREENDARVEATNEQFAIMSVGAKVVVAEFGDDKEIVELWPFEEFRKLLIKEAPVEGKIPYADYWLRHPGGRHYKQLVYDMPGGTVRRRDGDYNGWHDFTVKPAPGTWALNRLHVRDVICGGSDELFAWALNWCAALVQSPGRHAWSALVLRGGQGIGKGHFADRMLGALFHRQQYAHLVGANQLTGEFNEHLSGKCLVFADEATWGGDKQAAGVLKALVTENTVPIHRKFFKQVEEPSAMHIVIASNNEWPVPVEWDDRRFLVLDVDGSRKNDASYFEPLIEELRNGGLAAMLHDLLAHPVDERSLRNPPDTKAKRDLKALSLSAEERWLQDWLMDDRGEWSARVPKPEAYDAYKASLPKGLTPKSVDGVGKFLHRVFARAAERGMRDVASYPRAAKVASGGGRVNAWEFPPLATCRRAFDVATGTSTDWPEIVEPVPHLVGM